MRSILRIALAVAFVASSLSAFGGSAGPLPESERVIVEALISRLEAVKGAKFVRNGKAYPPETAGRFLRAKWKDRAARIRTADDFIETVASRSSTTGRPYLVRYSDGRETPTGTFLHLELRRIRGST